MTSYYTESLPSENLFTISMYMLQIGALVLVGRLVEAFSFQPVIPPMSKVQE